MSERVQKLGQRLRTLKDGRPPLAFCTGFFVMLIVVVALFKLDVRPTSFTASLCCLVMMVTWWQSDRALRRLERQWDQALVEAIRDDAVPRAHVLTRRK